MSWTIKYWQHVQTGICNISGGTSTVVPFCASFSSGTPRIFTQYINTPCSTICVSSVSTASFTATGGVTGTMNWMAMVNQEC